MKRLASVTLLFIVLTSTAMLHGGEQPLDYRAFLTASPLGVMTTVEGDQPRTRVFQHLWVDGDTSYFCTGSYKDVWKQLQANPRLSFCVWDATCGTVLSLDGRAVLVEDQALRIKALDENPAIKGMYKSADNPEFILFSVTPDQIYSYDFTNGKVYIKK